jgi:hypothetical protein
MQFFRSKKKPTDGSNPPDVKGGKKPKADIKHQLRKILKLALKYETTLIALAVACLLAVTSLKMLHYMDPPIDDGRVQESLKKYKKVHIDPKVVEKIKQLQDSGTSTNPNLESGRTNPFTE